MRSRSSWLLGFALLCSAPLGCVETFRQSGKQVASGAIEGSVQATEDPRTRRALNDLANDPTVQQSLADLSSVVAAGVIDGVTEEARVVRLEAATERLTAALGGALARSMERDLGPTLERLLVRSVARSLSEALGPATEQQVERISAAATRGALQGFESVSLDSKGVEIGALARRLSEQATLGFQDAVRTASRQEDAQSGEGEVLAAVGETADAALTTAPWIFWGLLLLVLGTTGFSVYLVLQLRKDHQRTQALSAAMSELRESASAAEVRAAVQRALGEARAPGH